MRKPEDYASFLKPLEIQPYVRYDPATGEIITWGQHERIALDMQIIDRKEPVLREKASGDTHYVDLADLTVKEKTPGVAVLEGLTLKNVPVPCVLRIDEEPYKVFATEVELGFDLPGTYRIEIESPFHFPQTFTVKYEDPA